MFHWPVSSGLRRVSTPNLHRGARATTPSTSVQMVRLDIATSPSIPYPLRTRRNDDVQLERPAGGSPHPRSGARGGEGGSLQHPDAGCLSATGALALTPRAARPLADPGGARTA